MQLAPVSRKSPPRLENSDAKRPSGLPKGDLLKEALAEQLVKLGELQQRFYADQRFALLVVLQGRDASGKDGVIRNVFEPCSPQGVQVTGFKAPSTLERAHDYLWRIHTHVPPRGMIGIFNRSHYEDVLAVRVHDIVPRKIWKHRFEQINDFERMLSENNVVILKFFLHISHEEQRLQLTERLTDPMKNWKFNEGDLKDRELWAKYTRAYHDALAKCSTSWAPWFVVPSDSKTARNYLVTRTIVDRLSQLNLEYPRAEKRILDLASEIA